jgi:hypothetical protein
MRSLDFAIDLNLPSRDSAFGTATGYGLDDGGVKNFLFFTSSRPEPTQPPIQWVPGTVSMGVKRPVRDADHSPRTNAEVKKMWIYTSIPPYAFMA